VTGLALVWWWGAVAVCRTGLEPAPNGGEESGALRGLCSWRRGAAACRRWGRSADGAEPAVRDGDGGTGRRAGRRCGSTGRRASRSRRCWEC
jgi:hypothetical protein